ncbi:MAG TPA: TRAP transporter small permease [Gammaproteobacteria bacterium]|nr:TRAP transporter small permease [Gammaproteobacteria bacterium]
MTRAARVGLALENGLLVALLGFLVVFSFAQIVLRNVFSIGVTWGDGLTRVVVLWLALLGALAASRDGRHIRMNAVMQWLPPKVQLAAGVGSDLFAAVVSGVLAYLAFVFVRDSRGYGDVLLGQFPAWWFQAVMPVAFALIAYRFALHAVIRMRGT